MHVHAESGDGEAKFWLYPEVRVAGARATAAGRSWSLPRWWESAGRRSRGPGVSTSVRARKLAFDRDTMWVELDDGRSLGVPLAWFPRLMAATAMQRENYRIGYSGNGLHWDEFDEDISVEGLLAGRADESRAGSQAG